jgi:hypothetical protein
MIATIDRDGVPGTWFGTERRSSTGRRSTDGVAS